MSPADDTDFPVYRAATVRQLLDPHGCAKAVRAAMMALSASETPQPLRTIIEVGPSQLFALMPGALANAEGIGAKVITAFADPDRAGRSAHRGVVVLFDSLTGALLCIADAGEVTHIRTAAASAVATAALARPDARQLAIFGYGAQARAHALAIPLVRQLDEIIIWGRSVEAGQSFAEEMRQETGLPVRFVADAQEAAQADILCTVTSAASPIVLGDWIRPGTHINVVGSSYAGPVEVDNVLVARSRFIADSRRSALAAAAEFLSAKAAGLIDDNHIVAELGEVLLGRAAGRTSNDQVTLYKSLGHIVQDLAATLYLHRKCCGTEL